MCTVLRSYKVATCVLYYVVTKVPTCVLYYTTGVGTRQIQISKICQKSENQNF